MIATVRIAPVERWCAPLKELLRRSLTDDDEPSSGSFLQIDTTSMKEKNSFCGGRMWKVIGSEDHLIAVNVADATDKPDGEHGWACEHMLEMD